MAHKVLGFTEIVDMNCEAFYPRKGHSFHTCHARLSFIHSFSNTEQGPTLSGSSEYMYEQAMTCALEEPIVW